MLLSPLSKLMLKPLVKKSTRSSLINISHSLFLNFCYIFIRVLITFEREKVITVTCAYRTTQFQHQYYVDPSSKSARKTELYGQQAEEKKSKIINRNKSIGNEEKKRSQKTVSSTLLSWTAQAKVPGIKFIYQLFWTQANPEGMCTNGTQV